MKDYVEWLDQLCKVDDSNELKDVIVHDLSGEEARQRCDNIKHKAPCDVVIANRSQFFLGILLFKEIQEDFKKHKDVNYCLNVPQSFVVIVFATWTILTLAGQVNRVESKDEWGDEKCVNSKNRDKEVPHFTEGFFCIDQVPFIFRLHFDHRGILIIVFVHIVQQCVSLVRFCHFSKASLES